MSHKAEKLLEKNGVFAGHHGLRGLAEASEFWANQEYGTRLYYGHGGGEYLHRSVLQSAVKILDNTAEALANLANAEQRIREFESCIQKVAAALGACCGGVDGDQTKAGATTRALLEKIDALKAAQPVEPEMSTVLFDGTPFTLPRDQAQRLIHAVDAENKQLRRRNAELLLQLSSR